MKLSEEREKEIRGSIVRHAHVTELLAEIDRIRAENQRIQDNRNTWKNDSLHWYDENQRLKERIERLEKVLTDWLASTKTDRKNEYCKINQYQAWNANRVLAEGDESAK